MEKNQPKIATYRAILATTGIDAHGEECTLDFLKQAETHINTKGLEGRQDHNPVGKITHMVHDAKIEEIEKGKYGLFALIDVYDNNALNDIKNGKTGLSLSWLGPEYIFDKDTDYRLSFDPINLNKDFVLDVVASWNKNGMPMNAIEWHRKAFLSPLIILITAKYIDSFITKFVEKLGEGSAQELINGLKKLFENGKGPTPTLIMKGMKTSISGPSVEVQLIIPIDSQESLDKGIANFQKVLETIETFPSHETGITITLRFNAMTNAWESACSK
jgi:hypothetical protein